MYTNEERIAARRATNRRSYRKHKTCDDRKKPSADEKRASNRVRCKRYKLLVNYNLTLEAWNAMFEAQGKRCKICRTNTPTSKRKWQLDHCHITGEVRGILCHHCNIGLGHFRDDPKLMRAAAAHVEGFRQWPWLSATETDAPILPPAEPFRPNVCKGC
jgi:hypothetical protein